MLLRPNQDKTAYLAALRQRMDSHFHFPAERATGFFLGPLFSVTYHSGWEWNRSITNEKNTAIGFVRSSADGCNVSFIILKGMLAPIYFLGIYALIALMVCCIALGSGLGKDTILPCLLASLGITAVVALIDAFAESLTERSNEGRRILLSILQDPSDPFSCLDNQAKLH